MAVEEPSSCDENQKVKNGVDNDNGKDSAMNGSSETTSNETNGFTISIEAGEGSGSTSEESGITISTENSESHGSPDEVNGITVSTEPSEGSGSTSKENDITISNDAGESHRPAEEVNGIIVGTEPSEGSESTSKENGITLSNDEYHRSAEEDNDTDTSENSGSADEADDLTIKTENGESHGSVNDTGGNAVTNIDSIKCVVIEDQEVSASEADNERILSLLKMFFEELMRVQKPDAVKEDEFIARRMVSYICVYFNL